VPIALVRRVLVLSISFENDRKWFAHIPVTSNIGVDDIIESIRNMHPEIASMVLRVGDRETKKGTKLIEVNPELEEPITFTKIVLFVQTRRRELSYLSPGSDCGV
jgi:hypothetical protein